MNRALLPLTALLLALVLPATAAAVTPGIPLWEGAKTGMSAEQVLAAFPEAHAVPRQERIGKRGPERGDLRVKIDRVEVAGAPYRGRFYFHDAGLERVVLDRILEGGMSFSQGLKAAGNVRDALSQHYGEPVKRQTGGDGYLAEWHQDQKRVRLVVVTQSYKVKGFHVIFEPLEQDKE
ncbi:MAG TPA: hypothetical protein VKA55_09680 [Gammaproteobacteria bacterium]|nr:hypothetical protein [Gammaproteobacteria bacterium]